MKNSNNQKIKIGIFTLVGIAVLLGGIFLIGSKKNLFGSTFGIYGTFKNIGGLQVGNNVRFAGINVGTVHDITIINDTTVRVDMILQKKVNPFIKTTTVATIGSDGLMGDKLITINASGIDGPPIKDGQRIATMNPMEYDKIIAKFTQVADNAESITTDIAGIVNHINQGKGSIGRLLYSDQLAKGLEGTVTSAQQTMNTVKSTTVGLNEDLNAAKHSFLLRGYFKKQAKKKEEKAQAAQDAKDEKSKVKSKSK